MTLYWNKSRPEQPARRQPSRSAMDGLDGGPQGPVEELVGMASGPARGPHGAQEVPLNDLLSPLKVTLAHLLRCSVAQHHQVWAPSRLASGQSWPPAARSGRGGHPLDRATSSVMAGLTPMARHGIPQGL